MSGMEFAVGLKECLDYNNSIKTKIIKNEYLSVNRQKLVSDCCNSPLLGENDGVSGRCSSCKENCMILFTGDEE